MYDGFTIKFTYAYCFVGNRLGNMKRNNFFSLKLYEIFIIYLIKTNRQKLSRKMWSDLKYWFRNTCLKLHN